MLRKTGIIADSKKILELVLDLDTGKHDLSRPTGRFFYDPWVLNEEYKGTELEVLFNQLESPGQVRVNVLEEGRAYQQHADLDDRYHLSLDGVESYLVDLTNGQLHDTRTDNIVYEMDAGRLHSAVNFGYYPRKQLVIRKLLPFNKLENPLSVSLKATPVPRLRYNFDQTFSVWFNKSIKAGIIANFNKHNELHISFDIELNESQQLENLVQSSGLPIEIIL